MSDTWERRAGPAAVLLLAALLVQGIAFIGEASQTSDEAAQILAGYSYLTGARFRMHREEPPLMKELAALPLLPLGLTVPPVADADRPAAYRLGRVFVHENRLPNDTILFLARLPILLLSLVLGYGIFRWGRRLFGARAALCGLALYVLDPNVVAHSSLVTTDLGVTLFMFFSVYALWLWSRRPSPRRLAAVGLMVGGAFASKFTSLWLLPILGALGLVLLAAETAIPERPWSERFAPRRLVSFALAGGLVAALACAVLGIAYGVVGLPAYLYGLERGLGHSSSGLTGYLLGRSSAQGWWYYFLLAYLIKTPPGTLILVAAAIAAALRGRRLPLKDEAFLWVPVAAIVLITCLWRVNIGLRHLLPIYPFLYLAAGRIAAPAGRLAGGPGAGAARRRGALAGAAIAACLAWNLLEAASIAPYDLAYFNELVGGPRHGHEYLLDSSLDWGQSSKALRRYMAAEGLPMIYCSFSGNSDPGYYGVRYQYVPGIGNLEKAGIRPDLMPEEAARERLAVGAMALHFVRLGEGTLYDWLRDRPVVAMPGYTYLVYDITGDADAHARLAALSMSASLPAHALAEAGKALRLDPGNVLARAVRGALVGGAPPGAPPASDAPPGPP